jgi:hypothetical protein
MSKRNLSALLALGAAVAAVVGILSAIPAGAATSSSATTVRVIVVMRNQEAGLPATPGLVGARRSAVAQSQSSVRSQLQQSGARNVHSYTLINAVSAVVSPAEEAKLRSNPGVAEVVPDEFMHLTPSFPETKVGSGSAGSSASSQGVCSTSGRPQLNPQALELMHAASGVRGARTARSLGFTGAGVKVGFIADGLDINNPDFIRPNGQHVIVDYKDFTGEGTAVPTGGEEAFGDASSIAAQGRETYHVAGYGPHATTKSCPIRIEGVAPGASVVALDVFGAENGGYNSSFLQAIDYAVSTDHVNVLNESLGNNYYPDDGAALDLIKAANDAAVAAGTTVTASSGDAGVTNTIGTPSTDPNVISAGATTSYRIDLQAGYGGAQFPGVRGYLNDNISSFSSGGFEQNGRTVDLVAPGELGWALCSTDTAQWGECTNYAGKPSPFIAFGGTSEAAPLTAGTAALVIQAYRKGHHGATPSPKVVKRIIVSTTDDIGSPADQQGSGRVDAYRAVLAAESYGVKKRHGYTLVDRTTQLNVVAAPGTHRTLTDRITNEGSRTQTIKLSGRQIGAYRTIDTQTVRLDDVDSPKTTDWAGVPDNYEPVRFTVPAHENRLNTSIAFQNASHGDLNARVRLTLVDPTGALAGYSVPQGDGNYGNIQVTDPRPGRWTAYIWSREASYGGTTGNVKFGAAVARYVRFGRVSPSRLTLRPGRTGRVTLSVSTPSHPGDSAGAIVIKGREGNSTIPVTLRSLIPSGAESFTDTLTGGNGRSVITGQTFYYQLKVPAGQPELNATVKLADNPNNPFTAFLISPSGEALATASNTFPNGAQELGTQLHVISPASGTWTLIVAFIPYVSGTSLTEPFTVSTDLSEVPASAQGLPDSTDSDATPLPAGQPQTATVTVTNHGPAPEAYFLDPRLPQQTAMGLVALCTGSASPCSSTTVPMEAGNNIPVYIVPTHTSALTGQASTTGSTPIMFDASAPAGDPDFPSDQGSSVSGTLHADRVAQGLWSLVPDVVGDWGPNGTASEPVNTSLTATANAFNQDMTSSTGDLWEVGAGQSSTFNPVVVQPGQTASIPVTITPSEAPGTKVTGTLYLDDTTEILFGQLFTYVGDEVQAFPYAYTVGSGS